MRAIRGFTLLELLLVLAIASVAFAVVVPNVAARLTTAGLTSSQRTVANHMMQVRTFALDEARTWVVRFAADQRSYTAMPVEAVADERADVKHWRLDEAYRFGGSESTPAVYFFSDGTCTAAKFSVRNAEGQQRWIGISRLTGVRLQ